MHAENGSFVLTGHPFVTGRASRITLLKDLVTSMRRFRDVWFTTCEEVAPWHAGGQAGAPADSRRAARPGRTLKRGQAKR